MTYLKPSDTEFYAIGQMVVFVGYIEQSISEVYARIYDNEDFEFIPNLMISKKLALINDAISSNEKQFMVLIKKTKNLLKRRNIFIHGQYFGESMGRSVSLYMSRKNLHKKITIKDIDAVSQMALNYRNAWKKMTITRIELKHRKPTCSISKKFKKIISSFC